MARVAQTRMGPIGADCIGTGPCLFWGGMAAHGPLSTPGEFMAARAHTIYISSTASNQ